MNLQVDEAEHDLNAGAFQRARQADVAVLVEAGLEFDQRGDRLAALGRLDQRLDDRAVLAGAIQGLLDRDHARILGRLVQELDDDFEALVRVVDDQVFGPDRGEAVAAIVADPLGKARRIGREQQVVAATSDDLLGGIQAQQAVELQKFAGRDRQMVEQEALQFFRHGHVHGQPDHRAATPPLECGLPLADQVFGLFFQFDVAVADHPEMAEGLHLEAGEQLVEEPDDQLFQAHEPDVLAGQAHEAVDMVGQDQRG